jgi:2-C-methyl-D-erythritol 4-phosphate cytidylyltransferase
VVWVVIVAAGSGTRFGGEKQYAQLGGRPVVAWSVEAASSVANGAVLVVAPDASPPALSGVDAVVTGGATRSESVRCGLTAVPDDATVVVVHDAARPLASSAIFTAVVDAVLDGADGAVPAVPVVDTIKRVEGDRVVETLDRSGLVAVQTPQAFRADVLRAAHASRAEGPDDASLVEAAGGRVVVVPGDDRNRKITVAADLAHLEALL